MLGTKEKNETKIFLGNLSPGEEIELKTFFFGHIINKDLSYQATFPIIFPDFIMDDPQGMSSTEKYCYQKKIVKGKIYINTRSKIIRLFIGGSKNFSEVKYQYGEEELSPALFNFIKVFSSFLSKLFCNSNIFLILFLMLFSASSLSILTT